MKKTFAEYAERFRFAPGITAHEAIRIVDAYVQFGEPDEDERSTFVVTPPQADSPCDGCGDEAEEFMVEQRHPEGGSALCEDCWLAKEGH